MNQRDLELLSAYLDGQLNSSESTRLESRLNSDPQLASVLTDLRATRSLLRKLPAPRAPRNFILTRKMVGQNPPLPRAYPIFRFATALATLLFIFSFGLNSVGHLAASQAPVYGMGGGGSSAESAQPFSVAPAATEAPTEQAPSAALAPAPTQILNPDITNASGIIDTPSAKAADSANGINPNQPLAQAEARSPAPLIPSVWQIILAVIAVASAILMVLIPQLSARHWK